MNWKLFLEGLESAASTGALMGLAQGSASGKIDKSTLGIMGIGALMGVLNYLKTPSWGPAPAPAPPQK